MKSCKIAISFASALLLVGAATGQQSSVAARSRSSDSESSNPPCQPQAPTPATPFDTCTYLPIGPGIRPPKAVNSVNPAYPEAARKTKLNGSVVVALAINEKGGVDDVRVVHSSNGKFEQSALDATKQWTFLPATRDGNPVAVQINAEVTFKLY